jgi:hypothetical protein
MGAEQTKPSPIAIDERVMNLFSQLFHFSFPVKDLVDNFTTNEYEWPHFVDELDVLNLTDTIPDYVGASGKIYIKGDRIIKEISIVHPHNLRGVFLESWIQTTLQNDSLYGSHIPQLFAIQRSKSKEMGKLSIFLTMEKIADTIQDVLLEDSITLTTILPYFKQFSEMLEHFEAKYAFRHRDLHINNVLFQDGKIYLIDFGRSSIGDTYFQRGEYIYVENELRFSEYTTSLKWDNVYSWSPPLDILTFLTSFRELYYMQMDADCKSFINGFVDDTMYKYMEQKRISGERVYFQTYPYKIQSWDEKIKTHFEKKVSIREFSKEIKYFLHSYLSHEINLNVPAYADI